MAMNTGISKRERSEQAETVAGESRRTGFGNGLWWRKQNLLLVPSAMRVPPAMFARFATFAVVAAAAAGFFAAPENAAATSVPATSAQGDSNSMATCATGVERTAAFCTVAAVRQEGWLQLEGLVEAEQQVTLAAQVAGVVKALHVDAGQRVRQGQLLLRVDARAATETTRATRAQTQAVRAQLAVAQKNLARQQRLYDEQFISQAALDQTQAQVNALAAQVAAQRAQTRAAGSQTDYYSIRAPFDGVVAKVHTELGDMAMPGRPVLQLYRADSLRATVHAPAAVAAQLRSMDDDRRGRSVRVRVNGRDLPVTRVRVLPVADAASNTVEVRGELDAESVRQAGVLPGEFARVSVRSAEQSDALAAGRDSGGESAQQSVMPPSLSVPVTALLQRAQMHAVYVVRPDGSTVLRYVRPGRRQSGMVAIASGLEAGEVVSLRPDRAAVRSLPPAAAADTQ